MENLNTMIGIHCFSTAPYWEGRGLCGNSAMPKAEFEMPDYLLHTLCLSALQWKRLMGPVILFTDQCFYDFLEKKGLLTVWSEVRVVLDELKKKLPGLSQSVFWAACKMYCYQLVEPPFVCIDTDLVILEPLVLPEADLVFNHYEILDSSSYGTADTLKIEREKEAPGEQDAVAMGLNMSICCFRSREFRDIFVEEAFRIMESCYAEYDGSYALPELLYMEQVMPVLLAQKYGMTIKPLMNCIWSPQKGCFTEVDPRYGYWIFFRLCDTKAPVMHLWFHKNWLEKNEEAREEYSSMLKDFYQKNYKGGALPYE